jgi:hypothetical protein
MMIESGTQAWKGSYQKALSEQDETNLAEMVMQAEAAIYLRFQELQNSSNHHEERSSMKAATDELLAIKVNRLGWPAVG